MAMNYGLMDQRTKIKSHGEGVNLLKMFELISKKDINNIIKSCTYISLKELCAIRNGWIIRFKDINSLQRFERDINEDKLGEFCKNSSVVYEVFKKISNHFRIESFYISRYSGQWFSQDCLAPVLSNILKEKKIRSNYAGGILTDDEMLIKDIFISAQKYNTFPVFISKSAKLAVIPTDHLDLFISSHDELENCELEILLKDEITGKNIEIVKWE